MIKKHMKLKMISLALILTLVFPFCAFAQPALDTDQDCSLAMECLVGETPVAGMSIDVYKIADVDKYGKYSLTDDFKGYEHSVIELDNLGGTNGDETAATLKVCVWHDGISPMTTVKTDSEGLVSLNDFSKSGMFLVVGHKTIKEEKKDGVKESAQYEMVPFLIAIPERDSEKNDWNYSVKAFPKCTEEKLPPVADYTVVKKWDDQGLEKKRPKSIKVDLMMDGKIYDTVKLSEDNNWEYTWTELETEHEWVCAEKDTSGYIVSYMHLGTEFVIENTPVNETPPGGDDSDKDKKLPQTGLLWWPVIVMAVLGLSFIAAGLIRKNREREN